jgi:hypothetical protein
MSIIKKVYYLVLILSFILSLLKPNREDKALRLLSLIILIGLCTQIIEDYLRSIGQSHIITFHLYNLVEYPLYCLFYYLVIPEKKVFNFIVGSVSMYILIFIYYYTFVRNIWSDTFGFISAIEGFFMTILSLYFYYFLIKKPNFIHLFSYPPFYIISANLIFFSLLIPSMSLDPVFIQHYPLLRQSILNIGRVTNILMYSLYCTAFICYLWKPGKLSL